MGGGGHGPDHGPGDDQQRQCAQRDPATQAGRARHAGRVQAQDRRQPQRQDQHRGRQRHAHPGGRRRADSGPHQGGAQCAGPDAVPAVAWVSVEELQRQRGGHGRQDLPGHLQHARHQRGRNGGAEPGRHERPQHRLGFKIQGQPQQGRQAARRPSRDPARRQPQQCPGQHRQAGAGQCRQPDGLRRRLGHQLPFWRAVPGVVHAVARQRVDDRHQAGQPERQEPRARLPQGQRGAEIQLQLGGLFEPVHRSGGADRRQLRAGLHRLRRLPDRPENLQVGQLQADAEHARHHAGDARLDDA